MHPRLPWDARFTLRSAAFAPLEGVLARLDTSRWPDRQALQRLIDERGIATASGSLLRLATAVQGHGQAPKPYELRIFENGEVAHRSEDWHDFFNALAWLTFPAGKAALNARHVRELARAQPGRRGPVRDALTLFDEEGVLVASSDELTLQLVREFRWKELFWDRREPLRAHTRFVVFGHALYQKALQPFVGMVGRALLMHIDGGLLDSDLDQELAALDVRLASVLSAEHVIRSPADVPPLPVLGIPGWFEAGEREAFYDDRNYFRPRRSRGA